MICNLLSFKLWKKFLNRLNGVIGRSKYAGTKHWAYIERFLLFLNIVSILICYKFIVSYAIKNFHS